MASSNNKIDLQTFCDLQSVSKADRFVLVKKFSKLRYSFDNWYELVSKDFRIGVKSIALEIKDIVASVDSQAADIASTPLIKKVEEETIALKNKI